jgi:hypothetical protein
LTEIDYLQASSSTQSAISRQRNKYKKVNGRIQKAFQKIENGELAIVPFLGNDAQRIELGS